METGGLLFDGTTKPRHRSRKWQSTKAGRDTSAGRLYDSGRETGLDPVRWLDDGWFVINEGKGPSNEQTAPDLPEVVYPKWQRDDFDSDTLDVHWQFVRRPAPGNYSLTERPGHMRIWTLDGQLFEIRAKNTLLRREESYHTLQSQSFHLTRQEMVNRPDLHVIIVQRHMHASHFVLKAEENCSL